jgi:hypothetical protein
MAPRTFENEAYINKFGQVRPFVLPEDMAGLGDLIANDARETAARVTTDPERAFQVACWQKAAEIRFRTGQTQAVARLVVETNTQIVGLTSPYSCL